MSVKAVPHTFCPLDRDPNVLKGSNAGALQSARKRRGKEKCKACSNAGKRAAQ